MVEECDPVLVPPRPPGPPAPLGPGSLKENSLLEAYLGTCQTSMMGLFGKIVNEFYSYV